MSNLKRKDKIYTSKNMTGREGEIITNNDYCLFKIIDRVYKYLHELYKVQTDILPRTHCQATRGHTLKLEKRPAHHRLASLSLLRGWRIYGTPSQVSSSMLHLWMCPRTVYTTTGRHSHVIVELHLWLHERVHTTENFLSQENKEESTRRGGVST